MPFDLGDVVPLTVEIRDADGALADAGAVTLTVTKPDGTTDSPTPTNPETGHYQSDYVPATAGRYLVRWVATGANASSYTDAFDVRPAAPPLLFSLNDAKNFLNISTTTNDAKIRDLLESTTAAVEHQVGPVVQQTRVELYDPCGSYTLVLRAAPIVSVTSMEPVMTGGAAYDVSNMDVDTATGIITNINGQGFYGPLRITYVAGRSIVPAAIRDAGRIILKHLWDIHNGLSGLPRLNEANDPGSGVILGMGYAIPNRALQLLHPYMRLGNFA